jgi:hypothetical protein
MSDAHGRREAERLSRSTWTIGHISELPPKVLLTSSADVPPKFDILPIDSFLDGAPIGDATPASPFFVDSAHGQLDRQLQCREAKASIPIRLRRSTNVISCWVPGADAER